MPNLTQSAGVLQIRKKARAGRTHFLGREGQDERLENPYRCGARQLGGGTAKFRHSRVVSDFQQTTFAFNGSTCFAWSWAGRGQDYLPQGRTQLQ